MEYPPRNNFDRAQPNAAPDHEESENNPDPQKSGRISKPVSGRGSPMQFFCARKSKSPCRLLISRAILFADNRRAASGADTKTMIKYGNAPRHPTTPPPPRARNLVATNPSGILSMAKVSGAPGQSKTRKSRRTSVQTSRKRPIRYNNQNDRRQCPRQRPYRSPGRLVSARKSFMDASVFRPPTCDEITRRQHLARDLRVAPALYNWMAYGVARGTPRPLMSKELADGPDDLPGRQSELWSSLVDWGDAHRVARTVVPVPPLKTNNS